MCLLVQSVQIQWFYGVLVMMYRYDYVFKLWQCVYHYAELPCMIRACVFDYVSHLWQCAYYCTEGLVLMYGCNCISQVSQCLYFCVQSGQECWTWRVKQSGTHGMAWRVRLKNLAVPFQTRLEGSWCVCVYVSGGQGGQNWDEGMQSGV